jgi:hypothetical protein
MASRCDALDGVEFVLLSAWHDVAIEASAWLYWHH